MGIRRWHVEKEAIEASHLMRAAIEYEIHLPLGYIPTGLATDSTGVKFETKRIVLSSQNVKHLSAAYLETDLQQLTGGTVAIDLYNYTDGTIMTTISLTATTMRAESPNVISYIIAGKTIGVRFRVVTAGAAGSVGGGCSPVLKLRYSIS